MEGDFRLGEWLVQPLRDVVESPNRSVPLEPKVIDLLVYLAEHQGEVIPKRRLIQAVWPDAFVTDEVLTNAIWKLRQAFADDPKNPKIIQTVPRRGYQLIAEVTFEEKEAEEPGSRYRVIEKLGRGAMAEVHLAEDTVLGRQVALKFVAEEMEQDGTWRRRLSREARAAASLDHPFICKVYDTGQLEGRTFIAMEYVQGEALKEKVAGGPLAIDQALRIARETAEALEIAHRKGIVHRDVKPSNIMLTEQGHVKVVDFGVAKRFRVEEGEEQEFTATLTSEASTLGTLPYMSPEQIRGQEVDPRSDIFSLGVVLYEMLTGVHPFRKGLSADTAAAVLSQEPAPLAQFRKEAPERLKQVLDKMLAKEREDRYPSIHDVCAELSEAGARTAEALPFETPAWSGKKLALLPALALLAVVSLAVFVVWRPWKAPVSLPSVRPLPLTSHPGTERCPALSPDGTYVAFAWDGAEKNNYDIYVQRVGSAEPQRLTTDPAEEVHPTWSPDGSRIAFLRRLSRTESAVFFIPLIGGPETRVADASLGGVLGEGNYDGGGLSWSPVDPVIAVVDQSSPQGPDSIFLLSLETRKKQRLTTPPQGAADSLPAFSPDGGTVAFRRGDAKGDCLCFQSLRGGETRCLTSNLLFLRGLDWTSDGSAIVFSRSEVLFQDPYLWKLPLTGGEPERLSFGEGAWHLSIARTGGRMAYQRGQRDSDIWRAGGPNSPEAASPTRFSVSSTRNDQMPEYSPDGSQIAFTSDRSGDLEIFRCDADGSKLQQLTKLGFALLGEWSPSGERIAFCSSGTEKIFDISVVDATGGPPRNLTQDEFSDACPSWSGDGRWIYFSSDRVGSPQVFKVSPQGGSPVQVTKGGGLAPRVADDGQVLFFRARRVWSVPGEGGEESLVLDKSVKIFSWRTWRGNIVYISQNGEGGPSIEMLDLTTRETTKLHSLPEGTVTGNGLTVSPDGQWILYAQFDVSADLMLVENFR